MSTAEPRQRWRLVVARSAAAPEQPQREVTDGWFAAIADAGLPVAWTEGARSRPRIAFGAPLPIGMAADAELIDVVLTERWPAWRLRETLAEHVPAGWRLVDVQDVWLAGPSPRRPGCRGRLPGRPGQVPCRSSASASAAEELLAAPTLPRSRARGDESVEYDLRPLLIDVAIEDGPPVTVDDPDPIPPRARDRPTRGGRRGPCRPHRPEPRSVVDRPRPPGPRRGPRLRPVRVVSQLEDGRSSSSALRHTSRACRSRVSASSGSLGWRGPAPSPVGSMCVHPAAPRIRCGSRPMP